MQQFSSMTVGAFIPFHHLGRLKTNRAQKTCPNPQCGTVWMHEVPQLNVSSSSPLQVNGEFEFTRDNKIICLQR